MGGSEKEGGAKAYIPELNLTQGEAFSLLFISRGEKNVKKRRRGEVRMCHVGIGCQGGRRGDHHPIVTIGEKGQGREYLGGEET